MAVFKHDPELLVFTALTTAVLVGLVVFKLWSSQHEVAASARSAAEPAVEV